LKRLHFDGVYVGNRETVMAKATDLEWVDVTRELAAEGKGKWSVSSVYVPGAATTERGVQTPDKKDGVAEETKPQDEPPASEDDNGSPTR